MHCTVQQKKAMDTSTLLVAHLGGSALFPAYLISHDMMMPWTQFTMDTHIIVVKQQLS